MRSPYITRKVRLCGPVQVETALALIQQAPLDADKPIEVVLREEVRQRAVEQNAYYWMRLAEIAHQAWVEGRQYSMEIWHRHFKGLYLPEDDDLYLDTLVKDATAWRKWDYTPDGERILIGSTTQLSKRGFAGYVERVEAFGADMGVLFSEEAA